MRTRFMIPIATLLAVIFAVAPPAHADGPSNDYIENAEAISIGSYGGSTVGATRSPTDPDCGDGATVWYAFTAPRDGVIKVDLSTYQPRDLFTALQNTGQCQLADNGYYGLRFDVTAGTTYWLMVSEYGSNQGSFILSVSYALSVTVATAGTVTSAGLATIHGDVLSQCYGEYPLYLTIYLIQGVFNSVSKASADVVLPCQPASDWSVTLSSTTKRKFTRGQSTVTVSASTCLQRGCVGTTVSKNVFLNLLKSTEVAGYSNPALPA